jgi:hypothetical protein
MVQSNLCRYERQLNGRIKGYWTPATVFDLFRRRERRRNDLTFSGGTQLGAALYNGESLKVYGDVNHDAWNAELYYMDQLVASSSSGESTRSGGNLTMVASSMRQPMYAGQYGYNGAAGGQCYAANGVACQAGYVPSGAQCCPAGGQVYGQQGYYGASVMIGQQMPLTQRYYLQFTFDGGREASVTLRTAAVACEDGRGNSYSCR